MYGGDGKGAQRKRKTEFNNTTWVHMMSRNDDGTFRVERKSFELETNDGKNVSGSAWQKTARRCGRSYFDRTQVQKRRVTIVRDYENLRDICDDGENPCMILNAARNRR